VGKTTMIVEWIKRWLAGRTICGHPTNPPQHFYYVVSDRGIHPDQFYGMLGEESGHKGKTDKVSVVVAVEMLEPKGFGRIRLRRIAKESTEHVVPFVQASIEPGAKVRTDGSAIYRPLQSLGYVHERAVQLGSDVAPHVSMAGVHRVSSLIKRWALGTHHGSIQPEHLDAYLDEFVFRFNRRTSSSRGMLFHRLMQQAVVTDPVTYGDIVSPTRETAEAA